MRYSFTVFCLVAALTAEDVHDPLAALPALTATKPLVAAPLPELTLVAPGIATMAGAVVLEGVTLIDQGPVDGLEVVACLDGGKGHEAFLRLLTGNGELVKAMVMGVLSCDDGQTAAESSGIPARGVPLRVQVRYADPDHPERQLIVDASCLVRDRVVDHGYPPLPFIYTGSRIQTLVETDVDGRAVRRDRFMLDTTKSLVVSFDEPDALLASPFPGAVTDNRFEANSAITPPPGTPCQLVISAVTLPLTLHLDAAGILTAITDGPALDDAALAALLGTTYTALPPGSMHAVAVQVASSVPREVDVAIRSQILAAAATAKVWVIPVFTVSR